MDFAIFLFFCGSRRQIHAKHDVILDNFALHKYAARV